MSRRVMSSHFGTFQTGVATAATGRLRLVTAVGERRTPTQADGLGRATGAGSCP
jgi:hypothetical protein